MIAAAAPPGEGSRIKLLLKLASRIGGRLFPPGWKPRLYGRQDACRYKTKPPPEGGG
jgi:hypothetical protein